MNFVRTFLSLGKSFEKTHRDIEKSSKNPVAGSTLSKRYPFKKPSSPQLKGLDGTFENIVLCIGVGIRRDTSNDCPLHPNGVLVWRERTLAKPGGNT